MVGTGIKTRPFLFMEVLEIEESNNVAETIVEFKDDSEKLKKKPKGKHTTCQNCNHKFRFVTEEERLSWKSNKFQCPSCGEYYCNMPPTEKELQFLQEEFLKNRSPDSLLKIYEILKKYISSLILKYYSVFIKDKEDLEYYSHVSASILIVNYDNPNFYIEYSFAGYIIWKIRETLFSKDEIDCADTTIEYAYSHSLDCSIMNASKRNIENEDTIKYLYKYLVELLYCKTNKTVSLKLTICFLNFILSGEKGSDRIFRSFDVEGKNIFYNVKNAFKNKLVQMVKS
jgi:hypothetical protein